MRYATSAGRSFDQTGDVSSHSRSSSRRGLVSICLLIGWTLFVWVGRIRNVLADDELTGWPQLWRASLATSFVVLALVAVGLLVRAIRSRTETSTKMAKKAGGILAIYGIVVWAIRGADIFLGSHDVAFKAVHTVLAVITITLGVVVIQRFVRAESDTFSE